MRRPRPGGIGGRREALRTLLGMATAALLPAARATSSRAPGWLADAPADHRFEASERLPSSGAARRTVLLVGDSLSITVGRALDAYLAAQAAPTRFVRIGMESSGLARPDFFDWPARLHQAALQVDPDVVLIMLGTNDNKSLDVAGDGLAAFRSKAWRDEYARRMVELFQAARAGTRHPWIGWVGAPSMRDAALDEDVLFINACASDVCARSRCKYLSTRQLLATAGGGFTATLDTDGERGVPVRAADGIHLLPRGAERIARRLAEALQSAGHG